VNFYKNAPISKVQNALISKLSQEKSGKLGTGLLKLKAHRQKEELRKPADIMFRYLPSVFAM